MASVGPHLSERHTKERFSRRSLAGTLFFFCRFHLIVACPKRPPRFPQAVHAGSLTPAWGWSEMREMLFEIPRPQESNTAGTTQGDGRMGVPENPTTLDGLVRAHLPQAMRFAIRLTGDVDAAEDVVQDALVRVARSWKTFRGDAEFRTWLFRVVINVFRDRLARQPPPQELGSELRDDRADDPAAAAQWNELGRLIAERVSALPPRQREVMVLITYEGLKPREVSGMLGISEANVYATLHAARQRLRTDLACWLGEKNDA